MLQAERRKQTVSILIQHLLQSRWCPRPCMSVRGDALFVRQVHHFTLQTDCSSRAGLTWACLPCTEKNEASKRLYSTSFPKRSGVP